MEKEKKKIPTRLQTTGSLLAKAYQKTIEDANPAAEAYDFESAYLAGYTAASPNVIYIIWNCSHEWDDLEHQDIIEYITTDLPDAIHYFHQHFANMKNFPADKYHYHFQLNEYPNGWEYSFGTNDSEVKTIINISNCNEEE